MVCNRCQKRPAIIFVQRMENGQMKNEGFCLHCARELHIKPVEDLMKQYTSLTHAFETGGGYLYRSKLVGVLKGLGFTEDEFSKPVATLSGGQKTRVALGRLLLQNPDLIIFCCSQQQLISKADCSQRFILHKALWRLYNFAVLQPVGLPSFRHDHNMPVPVR